jgi:hypothetical protein
MRAVFGFAVAFALSVAALVAPAAADPPRGQQGIQGYHRGNDNDRNDGRHDGDRDRHNVYRGWQGRDRDDVHYWNRGYWHGGRWYPGGTVYVNPHGYVWVPGYWFWNGYGYVWVPGQWQWR